MARVASGLILWQCGALDRAVDRVGQALDLARELDHPYSIAYALYHNGFLDLNRSRFEACRRHALELARLAGENDYAVWATLATVLEGVSLTVLGVTEQGLTMTETGIDLYQGLTTPPVFWPLILALRALVHAMAGQPRRALELIDEAVEAELGQEIVSVEFDVLKGDFLLMLPEPDAAEAEAAYLAAIEGSNARELRLVELQAWTRLVGLRRRMGRSPDGSDGLAEVYATFTEGFDEHDMVMARDMLGTIAEV